MRRTLILAAAVLIACIALCAIGGRTVGGALRRAEALRSEAVRAGRMGDVGRAERLTRDLSRLWDEREALLEMLTAHDALYEVRGGIEDALVCLESGDCPEFLRAMAGAGIALRSIRAAEAVCWANLY